MNLEEFKNQFICGELEISEDYGKIFSFVDFPFVLSKFILQVFCCHRYARQKPAGCIKNYVSVHAISPYRGSQQ